MNAFLFCFFSALILWWSISVGTRALWIARIGITLAIAFCIWAIQDFWHSPLAVFSNDGPLGAIVAARTSGVYWMDAELQHAPWFLKLYWIPFAALWCVLMKNLKLENNQ